MGVTITLRVGICQAAGVSSGRDTWNADRDTQRAILVSRRA